MGRPLTGAMASSEEDRASPNRALNGEERTTLAPNVNIEPFDELAHRYRGMCMRRASLIMRNQSDAEDVVQSALQKAFQYRNQFQGNGTFAGWLSRIVENECLMRIRKARNVPVVYLDNSPESKVRLELVDSTINPEDELGREEVGRVLQKEISRMPPLFRNVVLLHDSEQLPMQAVAEQLGLSVAAAKSRLERARKELRLRMRKHCGRKGPGTLLNKAVYNSTAYARAS